MSTDDLPRSRPILLFAGGVMIGLALLVPLFTDDHHLGDSGELATVVADLGVAHPPGYPVYAMLGHLWGSLLLMLPGVPDGHWVLTTNLFSALWYFVAIAAALGCFLWIDRGKSGLLIPWIGVVFFAAQPATLRSAVVTEVYTMHLALLALTWVLLAWEIRRRSNPLGATEGSPVVWFAALGLLSGLACMHHLTYVLIFPCSIWVAVKGLKPLSARKRMQRIAVGASGFVLGLLPILYLPLRSLQSPAINWGHLGDDPVKLWKHVTAAQYGSKLGNPLRRGAFPTLSLFESAGLICMAVLLIATAHWLFSKRIVGDRRPRRISVGLLLLHSAATASFIAVYEIHDIVDYFGPLGWNLALAASLAAGSWKSEESVRKRRTAAIRVVAGGVLCLAIGAIAETSKGLNTERKITGNLVEMWRSVPDEEAVVFHEDDTVGVLYYLREVAGERPRLIPFSSLAATVDREALREHFVAAQMAPVILYDAVRYPDAQRLLQNQGAVAAEVRRNVLERSPLPVYLFNPVNGNMQKRAETPSVDDVVRLFETGQIPADVEMLPQALVRDRIRELSRY